MKWYNQRNFEKAKNTEPEENLNPMKDSESDNELSGYTKRASLLVYTYSGLDQDAYQNVISLWEGLSQEELNAFEVTFINNMDAWLEDEVYHAPDDENSWAWRERMSGYDSVEEMMLNR